MVRGGESDLGRCWGGRVVEKSKQSVEVGSRAGAQRPPPDHFIGNHRSRDSVPWPAAAPPQAEGPWQTAPGQAPPPSRLGS